MNLDRMPILIGAGQITKHQEPLETCSSPTDLIIESAHLAAEDTGVGHSLLQDLDLLVLVRSLREVVRNSPQLVKDSIGAHKAKCYLTPNGGNTPQYLVNRYSEAIAKGELELALFAGAEALDNQMRCAKANLVPPWEVKQDTDFEYLYPDKGFGTKEEHRHGLSVPANCYPMFENALRHHYGRSIAEHQAKIGELLAPFTQVAANSATAWYPIARTAEEIATATANNRYVGWPYTKFMNAMNNINQGAALILASVGRAKTLGVPEDKWIYLHGCADACDSINITERVNYHSSPAMRKMGEVAFEQAGIDIADIDFIDLYSCFPVAVQIACDMLGIAHDDPRALTITGGLPYHGGAGSNYVMNSIATMVDRLRAHPGKKGMITANGGYLTNHALGLYSTEPARATNGKAPWARRAPAGYQAEIDNAPHPEFAARPQGTGRVEAYTVLFNRDNQPTAGLVVGSLQDGRRFCAKTPQDAALLTEWTQQDVIGTQGHLSRTAEDRNCFAPA